MEFREGEDVVVVRNLGKRSGYGEEYYFYNGTIEHVPLGSQGKIIKIRSEDKLLLQLKDEIWNVHPDEIGFLDKSQLAKLKSILPGIERIARHPVFEIAEQTPVFLVDDRVYSLGEGKVSDEENFFEEINLVRATRRPLVEVGDFESLDTLVLERAQADIEKIGRAYVKELDISKSLDGNFDIPQLIFKYVFPYLQDGNYKDKVSELLGAEIQKEVPVSSKPKIKVTKRLEEIADEIEIEVKGLISQIEQEEQDLTERTYKQKSLDSLLDYQEHEQYSRGSLLGKALNGENVAIVDGIVYDLITESDGSKKYIQIVGKIFSLKKGEEAKREPKADFEVGDRIRMNVGSSKKYNCTKEGSEGEIKKIYGNEEFRVEFTKITGHNPGDVPISYDVSGRYMENLSEVVVRNSSSPRDLEDRFLTELGKRIRTNALKEHLSQEKIIDMLRTQDAELLAMARRKEYGGNGFGFVQDKEGNYYAYLEVPAFAIKSEEDGNYYLYDKSRVGLIVRKEGKGGIVYDSSFYMIENNGHPYVHGFMGGGPPTFARICQGNANYPTSGKDEGEVIAKRLRRMKEVLMFGYTWRFFDPVYEGKDKGKDFQQYRRELSELEEKGIPIIIKGDLIK